MSSLNKSALENSSDELEAVLSDIRSLKLHTPNEAVEIIRSDRDRHQLGTNLDQGHSANR